MGEGGEEEGREEWGKEGREEWGKEGRKRGGSRGGRSGERRGPGLEGGAGPLRPGGTELGVGGQGRGFGASLDTLIPGPHPRAALPSPPPRGLDQLGFTPGISYTESRFILSTQAGAPRVVAQGLGHP